MRPEWIVVAAENIVLEVVRALVVFLTLACFHQAFGGSHFSVLAKGGKTSVKVYNFGSEVKKYVSFL